VDKKLKNFIVSCYVVERRNRKNFTLFIQAENKKEACLKAKTGRNNVLKAVVA